MPKSKLLRRAISTSGEKLPLVVVGTNNNGMTFPTAAAHAYYQDHHHDHDYDNDHDHHDLGVHVNPSPDNIVSTTTTAAAPHGSSTTTSGPSSSSSPCKPRFWLLLGTAVIGLVGGGLLLHHNNNNNNNNNRNNMLLYSFSGSATTPKQHLASIHPSEFAIVQWESRPVSSISSLQSRTFWSVAAQWNAMYAKRHGHGYYYIEPPTHNSSNFQCLGPDGTTPLQPSWCKIPAMLQVQKDHPQHKYWLYLESDAVINYNFRNQSLSQMVDDMQYWLPNWDFQERPMVFNQDGNQPRGLTYYIKTIQQKTNYTWALNAGTLFWRSSPEATKVLQTWWRSSLDSYELNNPLQSEFRQQWPLDQDRMMAIAHDNHDEYTTSNNNNNAKKVSQYIQIASQPDQMYTDYNRGDEHWCLSHTQLSNCFVVHYCRAPEEKVDKLMPTYYTYLLKEQQQQQQQQQRGGGGGLYDEGANEISFTREPLRKPQQHEKQQGGQQLRQGQ